MTQKKDYPSVPDMRLIFGDWCMATLRGIKHDVPRKKYIFVFAPDPFMIWFHQIQDSDYDETVWLINREYDEELCFCVNPDPISMTWFLLCDYNGNRCDPSIGINKELLVKNRSLKDERDAWHKSAILTPLKMKKAIIHSSEFEDDLVKRLKRQKEILRPDYLDAGERKKGGESSG